MTALLSAEFRVQNSECRMQNAEYKMQNAEYRMLNAYTACGILPGEEMVLSGSTESVIPAYISPSGKLCFKSWSRVLNAEC